MPKPEATAAARPELLERTTTGTAPRMSRDGTLAQPAAAARRSSGGAVS